jgi:hypothetical protein
MLGSITRPWTIRQTSEADAVITAAAWTGAVRDHGEADLIDALTPGAAITVERLAGIMLIAVGLIYLVLLGDIALSAFLAGTDLTRALVMRILVLGAVFISAALFGVRLSRPGGRTVEHQ